MNTVTETTLRERINKTLHKSLGFPLDYHQRLVHIVRDIEREADNYQPVWLMDGRAIIAANPIHIRRIAGLIRYTDLTAESIIPVLKNGGHDVEQMMFYTLVGEHFRPFAPDSRYTVRQLTHDDTEAFAVFQYACSDDDREMGEVGLNDEIVFGVLDGEKIVAVASTYELWGFVDVGVLTHPDYRQQGLGKAAVSAVSEYYLQRKDDERLKLYRHATANQGSGGIARCLNWQLFATVVYVNFTANQ
jgi:GNAT superfamily N-acetyltransferase